MKELCKHFCEAAQNDLYLDESYLHKFLIHKSYVKSRIECLISNGIITIAKAPPYHKVRRCQIFIFGLVLLAIFCVFQNLLWNKGQLCLLTVDARPK